MHTRKTTTVLVTTAVLGLALTACSSGGGDGDASEPTETAGSGELTISALNSDKAALEASIAAFEKQYPDIKVTTTWADTDQYQPTLRTQLTGGTAADVVQIWPGAGNSAAISVLAPAGFLEDLSGRDWAADVPDGLKPVLENEDGLYGLAVTVSGLGAVFNDQALADVGATPPTTWSEVLDLCQTAKDAGKVAFALGVQDSWVGQLIPYSLAPEMVYTADPEMDSGATEYTAPHFAGSAWTDVLAKYDEMTQAGCFNEGVGGTDYNTTVSMAATGDALGIVNGNWAIQALTEAAPEGATFSLHAMPASDDTEATRMAAAASGTYGVNADAANKANALAFMDFLASAEGTNAFAEVNAGLPGIPNDQFELAESLQDLGDYFNGGKTYPFMDQLWPNPDVQTALLTGVQGIFDGSQTSDDVLEAMDQAWEQGPA
ncbi:ABC transporter substrate-binding protein [Cellulomonas sp. DKR-3]|uniref:ABC transporter substrate-binding protein n=1 Tax=Cellulomonas fulva TaxID=2835530 RepID=A0ABS5TXI7_9CELL|nr:ABC transporter substrate-binding protein [Cellulomonas fulva]MBT0993841.1 ABC transporter substrate-binding protein [Cellulomonas fulva]